MWTIEPLQRVQAVQSAKARPWRVADGHGLRGDRRLPRVLPGRSPLAFQAGDVNLYRYVANFPTALVDPSGLDTWTVTATDLDYQDPRIGVGVGSNQEVGAPVAKISAKITVTDNKEYELAVTITSAVKAGTNTITEWYLRDVYYSSKAGIRFRPDKGFNRKLQPYTSTVEGAFTPKPKEEKIDFSGIKTEKDWELTPEVFQKNVTVKNPASVLVVYYVFDVDQCAANKGNGTITLKGPPGPGPFHGVEPKEQVSDLQKITVEWSLDIKEKKGELKLGQGPGTKPSIGR